MDEDAFIGALFFFSGAGGGGRCTAGREGGGAKCPPVILSSRPAHLHAAFERRLLLLLTEEDWNPVRKFQTWGENNMDLNVLDFFCSPLHWMFFFVLIVSDWVSPLNASNVFWFVFFLLIRDHKAIRYLAQVASSAVTVDVTLARPWVYI